MQRIDSKFLRLAMEDAVDVAVVPIFPTELSMGSSSDHSDEHLHYNTSCLEKVEISVEVCMKPTSTARQDDIRLAVERMLEKRSLTYIDGAIPVSKADDPFLFENVESILICDTEDHINGNTVLLFWQVALKIHVYQLHQEGPGEERDSPEDISSFQEWLLPSAALYNLWESLIYATGLKHRLLRYAETSVLFADKGVNPNLISSNRVIFLHGPPGTGKTSFCKALAQKLSIRFIDRYPQAQLVEVNAHSLFSKWYSESGKLVTKLFDKMLDLVEETDCLVFLLIDEVESLATARQTALSSEPSDTIRVVNALLTQLDKLKAMPNVVVLTTSNLTEAIDVAFVDRADVKAYVGPPGTEARYEILRSCMKELQRTGIILLPPTAAEEDFFLSFKLLAHQNVHALSGGEELRINISRSLLECAEASEGLTGRTLRKLPFLAHASLANKSACECSRFIFIMTEVARKEVTERL